MSGHVTHIWRHPIKGHGHEALEHVPLRVGQTLPWDRIWAVAHEASGADGSEWVPCVNFSRGAKAPALMAISARLDTESGLITLTHPDLAPLTFDPDKDDAAFLDWVRPLMPAGRAASARVVRAAQRGMTDTAFPSISLNSIATLAEVSKAAGQDLSPLRWRGNIWFDGLPAWAEFDWIGKRLRIGTAEVEIRERITRCLATSANPATGVRDADTLGALQSHWDHKDFGVYATVVADGDVAIGDRLVVL